MNKKIFVSRKDSTVLLVLFILLFIVTILLLLLLQEFNLLLSIEFWFYQLLLVLDVSSDLSVFLLDLFLHCRVKILIVTRSFVRTYRFLIFLYISSLLTLFYIFIEFYLFIVE